MRAKNLLNNLSVVVLGAINGLVVGFAAEEIRLAYLRRSLSEAANDFAQFARAEGGGYTFVEPTHQLLIPLACIVVFSVSSYLVYRYFRIRPQALLWVWLIMGAFALGAGYFMSTANPTSGGYASLIMLLVLTYFVHWLWVKYRESVSLLWLVNGVSAVIVTAFAVQLVGILFYWPELRNPLVWLLALLAVIVINAVFGVVVQFLFRRLAGRNVAA